MNSVQVIVFVIVVTFGIDRIVAILFGIIDFFDSRGDFWFRVGRALKRGAATQADDSRHDVRRGKRFVYFFASAIFSFALIYLSKYGIHISEEAIDLGSFDGEISLTNLDFLLTWLVLATGADNVTTLLGLSEPVGTIAEDPQPIIIEGVLDLKRELENLELGGSD